MRKRFGWHWYSICSIHWTYDPICGMCVTGTWVGPVGRFKSWYWYKTHYNDNGVWRKR